MATQLVSLVCVLLMWLVGVSAQASQPRSMATPGCPSKCGNITIPFPFGIGAGCSFNNWFDIDCKEDHQPFLKSTGLEVLSISAEESNIRVNHPIFSDCQVNTRTTFASVDLGESPFEYNGTVNRFTGVGCNNLISMSSYWVESIVAGCVSMCENYEYPLSTTSSCLGINCCQTGIPSLLKAFNVSLSTMRNDSMGAGCRYGFLVDQQWIDSSKSNIWEIVHNMTHVPVLLDWGMNFYFLPINETIPSYNNSTTQCNSTLSRQIPSLMLFQCRCNHGYQGNPYLHEGCQDVDECQSPQHGVCPSPMICENRPGTYICYLSERRKHLILSAIVGGLGLAIFTLSLLWWLHRLLTKRKIKKLKEKNFKRNGGLLLQQQLSSNEVNVDKIRIFNSRELEKATDNFRILGSGGQGFVYKGMLADGKIVAVKKSKLIDERKVKQFINEVVILSQIRHRNVVKLLGCCLETEVPLLVYEFIPNGTLYQYLHSEQNEEFPLTWEMRLQIATDVAGALSYLHSSASLPIYHRDIKSSNILLDERYKAKIADFGASRSIDIDQTHLTTRVQGTFGYLDPEFFQSSHFTEKSDVYSFGVVLVELLTGKKPITSTLEETQGLASLFVISMEDNNVFDILDTQVLGHSSKEQVMAVANLAKRCLNLNGKNRPAMKEVVQHLESFRMSQTGSIILQDNEEQL
ncbi:putative wall-associated receptor kinase-like 11 [Tripterygium wilfordii]|uniref:putative wall-associated receptor kinase-like 11 n=1 Tax=Tripterygium wilfordii TaxID=458696 RepID=UPI0018F80FB9|nr:putative wall-associated receptor kinase-like 11 [Tripterygium wilfordii]